VAKVPINDPSIGASAPKRPAPSPTRSTTKRPSSRCCGSRRIMRNWRDAPSGGWSKRRKVQTGAAS